jgi:hypothetical protein
MTVVTTNRHAARLVFQKVSKPNADSERFMTLSAWRVVGRISDRICMSLAGEVVRVEAGKPRSCHCRLASWAGWCG